MGDAAGIGPEVVVKTLSEYPIPESIDIQIIGEIDILDATSKQLKSSVTFGPQTNCPDGHFPVFSLDLLNLSDYEPGKLSRSCGDAAFKYFEHAIRLCQSHQADGIVTAPINKEAINLAGHRYIGHTEILERYTNRTTVMCIVYNDLYISHVTDHMPLRKALEAITPELIIQTTKYTHAALQAHGIRNPTIALAGINPHAGENGLLGSEESEIIEPAIQFLKNKGLHVVGPVPADTVFYSALKGAYHGIIAMYHDQGFAPIKTLDLAHGVNCTLGIPFVRTSPDHGTAFDLVGKGVADATSMKKALEVAIEML